MTQRWLTREYDVSPCNGLPYAGSPQTVRDGQFAIVDLPYELFRLRGRQNRGGDGGPSVSPTGLG